MPFFKKTLTTYLYNKSSRLSLALMTLASLLLIIPVAMPLSSGSRAMAQTAPASPGGTYSFDKTHTQILFFVNHLGFSISEGEFLVFDGKFEFNPDTPSESSVNVTIKAESIEMDSKEWNDHMRSKDFFNVETYPEITFDSTEIKMTGENTALLTGDLTMLGQTHPVTLEVIYNKSGVHPVSKAYVSGFSATGSLDRAKWGMNYGIPGIGQTIELRIEVEGIRQ